MHLKLQTRRAYDDAKKGPQRRTRNTEQACLQQTLVVLSPNSSSSSVKEREDKGHEYKTSRGQEEITDVFVCLCVLLHHERD